MELTKIEEDILLEIGNIGIGNCITALSQMINELVDITLPKIRIIEKNEFFNKYNSNNYIIHSKIFGDISGHFSFILSKDEAIKFSKILTNEKESTDNEINEIRKSALMELTNIVGGSYISSISNFSNMKMLHESPKVMNLIDNSRIIDLIEEDKGLEIHANFMVFDEKINSKMILIIGEKHIRFLINKAYETALEYKKD